ncbi:hypothetical protein B566_EDAN007578 [Ephemera danica]|nr:hypothetical protein B566_EDAN007578 [Ephemera danica]
MTDFSPQNCTHEIIQILFIAGMSVPFVATACHRLRVRMLYKAIQRLHRGLPVELSELGSAYTRDEFKRHENCNQQEAAIFVAEWTQYALTLAEQLGLKGPKTGSKIGNELPETKLDDFRDDQIAQLYELMIAAKNAEEDQSQGQRDAESPNKKN